MAFSPFSESARMRRLSKYIENESLFVCLSNMLENIDCPQQQFTKIEMWEDAKELALKLLSSKRPDLLAKELLYSLSKKYVSRSCGYKDDVYVGIYFETDLHASDVTSITRSVFISLYAIVYYQFKLIDKSGRLSLLVDKIKQITGMGHYFERIELLVDQGIVDKKIVLDYDYSKDEEHQYTSGESDGNTENVTFERKNQKGENVTKSISAGEIAQIVKKYPWKDGMTKDQMQKMLSGITGLSEASFKNALVD